MKPYGNLLVKMPLENKLKGNSGSGLVTIYKMKEIPLKHKHWIGTHKGHAEGEGPEVLGGEVFSMRQKTVARHGKKSRHWQRIESNGRLLRRIYALKIEQKD
jgi:hypothetical protein